MAITDAFGYAEAPTFLLEQLCWTRGTVWGVPTRDTHGLMHYECCV